MNDATNQIPMCIWGKLLLASLAYGKGAAMAWIAQLRVLRHAEAYLCTPRSHMFLWNRRDKVCLNAPILRPINQVAGVVLTPSSHSRGEASRCNRCQLRGVRKGLDGGITLGCYS